ncbi:phage integrase SAM-like domain-containing protein [Parabacteroides sp. AF48-14]|uniref:phage integrase SAM-like domain-containing protein n=1 Tax=Parabacteroides sp. AF48-14 TaxID=2292052 RepID=UPI003518B638
MRVIHNRQVKTVTLPGCRLYPEEWNKETQEVIYPDNNPRRLAALELLARRVNDEVELLNTHLQTLEKQGRYSVEDLVRLYRQRKDNSTLSGYCDTLASELKRLGQGRTANAYRTVTRGLIKFNKGQDIPLREINARLIKEFEIYLKTCCMPNTISYYMRNLRAIYNKAVAEKIIRGRDEKPFAGVYTGVTKTMKRALRLEEVQKLLSLDLNGLVKEQEPDNAKRIELEKLYTAQRYFAFCFNARGMCFIDLAYLQKSNIRSGVIKYVRKKTGQQMEVKVNNEMKAIIDSFSKETAGIPFLFPIIRDMGKDYRPQYENGLRIQNLRLKKLAVMADIPRQLSTHWARHSWANMGKQQDLPLRVISECLGHKSEKTTLIYLDQLDNSLLDSANDKITSAVYG